jgi:hypothetical protein
MLRRNTIRRAGTIFASDVYDEDATHDARVA